MLELTIGNPKTIRMILPDQGEPIELQKCDYFLDTDCTEYNKIDFKNKLIEKLNVFKNGNLCLSGGYDSQFMALLMKEADIRFNTIIYQSLWGDNVVNANDVLFSERFCKKHDFKYEIISIDAKEYFEKTLMVPYVKKYRSVSPQIIFHLYFLDIIKKDNLIMGGDIPYITYHERFSNPEIPVFSTANMLQYYMFPYVIYKQQNNIKMLKDIFFESPDILYYSILNNIEVLKNFKVYQPTSDGNALEKYRYKEIYYNTILEIPLENRLMCATGFENLKKHFASTTGEYDKFDQLYRKPLFDIKQRAYGDIVKSGTAHFNMHIKNSLKIKNSNTSPDHILSEYMDVFKKVNPSALKDYLFDF